MAQRGRPRLKGPRFPGGQLKPPGPNERVIASRRALLGEGSTDLSKAECALDVALIRGWITEERHRAARRYSQVWARHARRVFGATPGIKVSQGPISQSSPVPIADPDAPMNAGMMTPADYDLARAKRLLDEGQITERAYSQAERAHRAAKVDWSRLPDEKIAAIFTAALDLENYVPPGEIDPEGDADLLRRIWARLSRREAQELFATCVLDTWPEWVTARATGDDPSRIAETKRRDFEMALDVVIHESRGPQPKGDLMAPMPMPTAAAPPSPKRTERTEYVDPEGNLLYEVERRVRR